LANSTSKYPPITEVSIYKVNLFFNMIRNYKISMN
jgi:hypothetical protein